MAMLKIKVQDTVKLLKGRDRGKQGKVTQILPADRLLVVDGVNKMYKYIKPQKRNDKGQRIEFFGPVKIANVQLVCPKCSKAMRPLMTGQGRAKKRQCRKCKETID